MLDKLKKGGTFILVSSLKNKELIDFIPNKVKKIIIDKEIKMYVIDAYDIAKKNNIFPKLKF
jgi:pyruvate-ferredoxin/flavodoxin oxidoreductase